MPIAIVVDTDIVRTASGESSAEHAKLCARVLDKIREGDFILALSEELKREWLKERADAGGKWKLYISLYAFFWWSEMKSRRRVRMYPLDADLGASILRGFAEKPDISSRVAKDLHVVLTAVSADRRLISGNRRERGQFQAACSWVPPLASLLWPFPLDDGVVAWLGNGAPDEPEHLLCHA